MVVTSAVIPIPLQWMLIPRVRVAVSVDGLPEHHDVRRKPATYEHILRNIAGARVNVHWTITRAMAAKAGQVVSGYTKVEAALGQFQGQFPGRAGVAALIHASDGAADGIRKLDALVRQKGGNRGESAEIPIISAFTSAELDLALGRSNVIHAALLAGPASKTFLSRSQTLVRYRLAGDDKIAGTAAANSE